MSYVESLKEKYGPVIKEMKKDSWSGSLGDTLKKIRKLSPKTDEELIGTEIRDCLMVLASEGKISIEKQPPKFLRVTMNNDTE